MYRTIASEFWTDPKVRQLSPEGKLFFLYLITNPHSHVSGLYYLSDVTITHETGLKTKGIDTLWHTLSDLGLAKRDTENELIWVISMMRRQFVGAKVLINVRKHLSIIHNSSLVQEFREKYKWLLDRVSIGHPSKSSQKPPIQEQEQEQEQDKKDSAARKAPRSSRTRKPNPELKPNKTHQEFIDYFTSRWAEKYRVKYAFSGGRDAAAAKTVLKAGDDNPVTAKAIADRFLANIDPFIVKLRHPLSYLANNVNMFTSDSPLPTQAEVWQRREPTDDDMQAVREEIK